MFIIIAIILLTTTLDSTTYTIASYTGTKNMSKAEFFKKFTYICCCRYNSACISFDEK
nr:hypothetical protein [Virgibacillus sp. MSJ-26]